ncbi:MAG: N-acyl homoserine lactonase family protein [Tabrizicola sp.]|nr:N-acyl homoserine lactonase family protein [Tabrizicola sp.]
MILPGKITRLYVLDLGLFEVRGGERLIGIPGFLLETDQGARILFDTGFPPAYATDPDIAARDGLPGFGRLVDFGPALTAEGALALLGLSAQDIDLVILSHGHIDHVGSLPLFAHAPIVMTRKERSDDRPSYFGTARPMDWPKARYHLIDSDTPVCAGLTLLPTPGHTPGHLSALVSLPDGRAVILAADAINRISEPDEGFADAADPAAAMVSFHRLQDIQRRTGAEVIYGHEPSQWPLLPKAPTPW